MSTQIILPTHRRPSPSYPLRQRQTYDPSLFVHRAFGAHLSVLLSAHSSKSKRFTKHRDWMVMNRLLIQVNVSIHCAILIMSTALIHILPKL